ncbi:MAG TPA: molybdopterin cofactor-binding domain-containing protein [Streptosporangiaceae bacterium]|nr:molybdopterin cofactor-binding domain-containing protein [Streptosporangiaceae bacterium]
MGEVQLELTVDGATRRVSADPDAPLLDVLRQGLGLCGPRFGCGLGLCGACMVLIDGQARTSCDYPAQAAAGAQVTTAEGLGTEDAMHAVQQAFLDEQAAQCGYCTSGMLIAAAALLSRNPDPTQAEVREALEPNLCRCGIHGRIVRAVLRAGAYLRDAPVLLAGPAPFTPAQPPPVAAGPDHAPAMPASLTANPQLAGWLDLSAEGVVTVSTGKVELGQGIWTALAQVAAEELDVALARVQVAPVRTDASPDEGATTGSRSVEESGRALRQACAQARLLLLGAAAAKLATDPGALAVADGQILHRGTPTGLSYWSLAAPGLLARDAGPAVPAKAAGRWSVSGRSAPRLDLPGKVTGQPSFIHDVVLAGMLSGRVIRPPGRAAALTALAHAELPPGAVAVRDGSFLGVVAPGDRAAWRAARTLARAASWAPGVPLPDEHDLKQFLLSSPSEAVTVDRAEDTSAAGRTAQWVSAEYSRPFIAHASLAPSCGLARWDAAPAGGGGVTVWTHSQGVFGLRDAIASGLGLDAGRVTVHFVQGAGCYGHNGADDAALDAVLLARAVPGRPVRVAWSREDEMGWSPFGPAMLARLSAGLDAEGRVTSWRQDVWSNGFLGRPGIAGEARLLGLASLAGQPIPPAVDGPPTGTIGSTRNAVPGYDVGDREVVRHRLLTMPLRTSSLRSLGAFLNVFAIESFMDELASAAGADPVAFRLNHLSDPRARRVVEAVAESADWASRPDTDGTGYGVGYARYKGVAGYCAAVAEVVADTEVHVRRLWLAVDVGRVINPDGVLSQAEGGAVQATSWVLTERVGFSRSQVTSLNWDTYPILRFSEVPQVSVRLVGSAADPESGAGELAQGPVAGAIGNAVADALGVRVRDLPFTHDQVARALTRR